MNSMFHQTSIDLKGIPVIGICGYSNSGKTTLLEKIIARYTSQGYHVSVIKQYSHEFDIDSKGKDTDRLFSAGATVSGSDSTQQFFRKSLKKQAASSFLHSEIYKLGNSCDLVLVEGRKNLELPVKIWLRNNGNDDPPACITPIAADLNMSDDRIAIAADIIDKEISNQFRRRPMYCGIYSDSLSTIQTPEKTQILKRITALLNSHIDKYYLLGKKNSCFDYEWLEIITSIHNSSKLNGFISPLLRAFPHSSWLFLNPFDSGFQVERLPKILSVLSPGIWSVCERYKTRSDEPVMIWADSRSAELFESVVFYDNPKVYVFQD